MNESCTHSHCGGCIGDWKERNKALLRRRTGRKVQGQRDAGAGTREATCDVRQAPCAKTGSQHRPAKRSETDILKAGTWGCGCVYGGLPLLRIPRATKTSIEKLQPMRLEGAVARIPPSSGSSSVGCAFCAFVPTLPESLIFISYLFMFWCTLSF